MVNRESGREYGVYIRRLTACVRLGSPTQLGRRGKEVSTRRLDVRPNRIREASLACSSLLPSSPGLYLRCQWRLAQSPSFGCDTPIHLTLCEFTVVHDIQVLHEFDVSLTAADYGVLL